MSVPALHFLTIGAINYLPRAALLLGDLRRWHPEASLTLVLSDRRAPIDGLDRIGARVLWVEDIGLPRLPSYAFRYDRREFGAAIKAHAVRLLLAEEDRPVVYLDPDIRVFARLDAVQQLLADGAGMVLTPHILRPLGRSRPPRDLDILRAGCFNLGFLAVRGGGDVDGFLDWWAARVERAAFADGANGVMCDQRYFDLAPAFVERLSVLRDPAFNVAYWNIGQRRLERGAQGLTVDGLPLVFFHFSGFGERRPQVLSRYYLGPVETADRGVLLRLLSGYAAQLAQSPFAGVADHPYGFGRFDDGTPVPDGLRRLFADRLEPFDGDPFRDLPALLAAPDGAEGLTRLMSVAASWAPVRRAGHRIDAPDARERYRSAFPALARELALVGSG